MTDQPPKVDFAEFIEAVKTEFQIAPWQRELINEMLSMSEDERLQFVRTMRTVETDMRRAMRVRIDAYANLMFDAPVIYEDPRDPREPLPGFRMYGP